MNLNKFSLITSGVTLLSAIIIAASLSSLPQISILWSYFYIFVLMLILNNIIFYQLCDVENDDCSYFIKILFHMSIFITGIVIFLIFYCFFIYPLQSITFESFTDCQVQGKLTKNLQGSESYSILYTNFRYKGQNMLGYACQSNNYSKPYHQTPYPYQFIKKNSYYNCENPIKNDKSYEQPTQRVGTSKRQREILNKVENFYSRSRSRTNQAKAKGCLPYDFSQVKLPSWACVDYNLSHEQLTKPQDCYVNFYENQQKAYENSQERRDLRSVNNFAFVSFQSPLYYDKNMLFSIIIYALFPFLLSLDSAYYELCKLIRNCVFNRHYE
ncbi:transmembrane protein, putative (macronuclear) [Tetrahymena thermophila SB210]|uniref:Transmembrane protein, putative n=1 Tax=Tetrahymena thermophila (strain SB210) TaxID=312017 RepID=I7MED7_TETTS|nr:transmembrane protein, putative [Tetrahymena thermophila SB210]EAR96138.2 transmembrane protein, putative [Tetrahymena thermophila SB210]|eukprot:XP_001016383.2 transmembrane protein, putative [Tetrahymena thermophila SB210]